MVDRSKRSAGQGVTASEDVLIIIRSRCERSRVSVPFLRRFAYSSTTESTKVHVDVRRKLAAITWIQPEKQSQCRRPAGRPSNMSVDRSDQQKISFINSVLSELQQLWSAATTAASSARRQTGRSFCAPHLPQTTNRWPE